MVAALRSSVTCPWCARYFEARPERGHCDNCGGQLPAPAGPQRGAAPPPAPRALPAQYRRSVLFTRNVLSIVGAVFLGVGTPFLVVAVVLLATVSDHTLGLIFSIFGLLFPGLGGLLLSLGLRRGRRRLAALEHGEAAEGELLQVAVDYSETINGRHPWNIEYTFSVGGERRQGSAQSWSAADGERRPGEPVWVVYVPSEPEANTLWPPLR